MSRCMLIVAGAALVLALSSAGSAQEKQQRTDPKSATGNQIYTCPMHQQIQWSRPDQCPVCNMKLVAKGAQSPPVTDEMADHSRMSMGHEGMHDGHGGMSMMMGCGCAMCMEMMGMGYTNGNRVTAPAPATRRASPTYMPYPSRRFSRGCGC